MSGVYKRIKILMKHLDNRYDPYMQNEYFKALRSVIDMSCRGQHEFKVDSVKKVLIVTGRNINFFNDKPYEEMEPEEHPFTEDIAEKVFEELLKVALDKVDPEFKNREEEQRQKEYNKRKRSYLTTKLFGQSMNFIREA